MRRILLSLLLCLFCLSSFGQNTYERFNEKVEKWYDGTSADPLPKGAKLKTVDITKYHYCIKGYFYKGILAQGQVAQFYNTEPEPSVFLEGKVSYVANRLLITGVRNEIVDSKSCQTFGSFWVSNATDGSMVYKPKKADSLVVTAKEVNYYKGYYLECPAIVALGNNPGIAVDGKTGGRDYSNFSAKLNNADISKIGYDKPYDLLLTVVDDAYVDWSDGRVFRGRVSPASGENGTINFTLLSGQKTGTADGYRKMSVVEDGDQIQMVLEDNPDNMVLSKEIITVADKSLIPAGSYWDLAAYFKNMDKVRWEYRNGDLYEGRAVCDMTSSEDGGQASFSTKITEGTYVFANGDSFEGDCSADGFYGIMIAGTTHFNDGTSKKGNWLSEYDLTSEQYSKLPAYRCPSDIRDSATVYRNNNLYEKYMLAAKKAENNKKYTDVKRYYQAAKELKPDAEKWDDLLKEVDVKIKKEQHRQQMMQKYGTIMGNKIAEGTVEIGMTKNMVIDAFSGDDILLHSYRTSSSTDWSNNKIEIWEYDYDMAKRYMDKEMGDSAGVMNLMLGLASAIGYNLQSELSKNVKYKYLKFKNNTLVEIRDNSIYDDIDNATNDLNSSLWLLNSLF